MINQIDRKKHEADKFVQIYLRSFLDNNQQIHFESNALHRQIFHKHLFRNLYLHNMIIFLLQYNEGFYSTKFPEMWVKVYEIKEFIDICLAMPVDKNKLTIYEEEFCKFLMFKRINVCLDEG